MHILQEAFRGLGGSQEGAGLTTLARVQDEDPGVRESFALGDTAGSPTHQATAPLLAGPPGEADACPSDTPSVRTPVDRPGMSTSAGSDPPAAVVASDGPRSQGWAVVL